MKKKIEIPEGWCTAGDLAKRLQIGVARITQFKNRGVLKADRNNLYNIEESKAAMKTLVDQTSRRGLRAAECKEEASGASNNAGVSAAPGSLADSLARKEAAKAQMTEIELRIRKGEVVEVIDLKPKLIKAFTDVKTRIRAVAPKVAQAIAHLKLSGKSEREQIAEIQRILSKEHDEALEELAHWKL